MKLLLLLGPNLNLTGTREPSIYGTRSMDDIKAGLEGYAQERGATLFTFQSNSEGALIDKLQDASKLYDGVILNAGAYSHYSYAIADAIRAANVAVVEVHMSNIFAREGFRTTSVIAPHCIGMIAGFGEVVYNMAIDYFIGVINKK